MGNQGGKLGRDHSTVTIKEIDFKSGISTKDERASGKGRREQQREGQEGGRDCA